MARIEAPVHVIRLATAAGLIGLLVLWMAMSFDSGTVTFVGILFTIGLLIWLGVQPTTRPVLDGWLLGSVLGLGLGGLMGYGAYQISDFCFVVTCEKQVSDFWIWFLPILLGQMLLGLAVGSLGSDKDQVVPGFEGLPPVHRGQPSTPLPHLPEEGSARPRAGQRSDRPR